MTSPFQHAWRLLKTPLGNQYDDEPGTELPGATPRSPPEMPPFPPPTGEFPPKTLAEAMRQAEEKPVPPPLQLETIPEDPEFSRQQ